MACRIINCIALILSYSSVSQKQPSLLFDICTEDKKEYLDSNVWIVAYCKY